MTIRHKYLSVMLAGVGLLGISYIVRIDYPIEGIFMYDNIKRMFYIIMMYEVITFIFVFLNIDKKLDIKKLGIATIIITFTAACLMFQKRFNFLNNLNYKEGLLIKLMLAIILLLLYVVLYFLIKKNKEKITIRIVDNFNIYLFLRVTLVMFVLLSDEFFYPIKILLLQFIRCCGDYFIFKIMVFEVIRYPHEILYKDLLTKSKDLEENLYELQRKSKEEEAKSQLLANISHEFKTPVNVIYSAIQMQELKKDSKDIDEILKFNNIIKQNCYRLIRLINNFIDSSKLKQKDYQLDLKCMNIVDVVESTTMSILSFAEIMSINVVFDTTDEEIFVLADKDMLERSILNILSNAIKYNKENGDINVFIKSNNNNKVTIEIEDTGLGIPEEKQKVIFNRFERVDKSSTRHKEGSGLGLNIVKEIINKLNGEIQIFSKEGIGTKAVITLPKTEYDESLCDEESNNLEATSMQTKVQLEMSDLYL